ncbi:MAG: LamG-like jellyroll fold domain-containing protein [Chloroflexaceae bacterium]
MNYKYFIPGVCLVALLLLGAIGRLTNLSSTPPVAAADSCPAYSNDGPVAYWKLNSSGPTYTDAQDTQNGGACDSTNCNLVSDETGEPDTAPVITAGRVGDAQSFNGNAGILISDNATFDWGTNDSFSIAFWTRSTDSGTRVMVGRRTANWWIGHNSDGFARFFLSDGLADVSVTSSTKINDGEWHYVVAVRDAAANKNVLYVDDGGPTEVTQAYTKDFATSAPITLGWYAVEPFYTFTGTLDEVAIYNRALPPDEIITHYQYGQASVGYCFTNGIPVMGYPTEVTITPMLIAVGENVTFTHKLQNTGGVPAQNISITDANCTPIEYLSGDTTNPDWLDPGEIWTFTCTKSLNQDTIFTGTTTARADAPDGAVANEGDDYIAPISYSNIAIDVVIDPEISITSYTVMPSLLYQNQVENVTFIAIVENTGTDPLTDVNVIDTVCGSFSSDDSGPLAVNTSRTFTCMKSLDLSTDTTSIVTVTASDLLNVIETDSENTTISVINPGIALTKTATPTELTFSGTVDYTYVVENSGDDPLSNVSLEDPGDADNPGCSDIAYRAGDTNDNDILDVNESWTYTCSTVLEQDTNSAAQVTADDSRGNTVTATADAPVEVIAPAVALTKTVDTPVVAPGTAVVYTYAVSNTGDYPLSAITVSDTGCAPVEQQSAGNNDARLDVGEIWIYTCSTDVNADTDSTATVVGEALGITVSDSDSAAVDLVTVADDAITIIEQANPAQYRQGTTVTFTYRVTNNDDDDAFTDVTVTDPKCTPISGPTIITGNDDALLDPGEIWEYTCSTTYDSEMEGLSSVTAQDLLGNEQTASAPRLGFLEAIEIYLPLIIR